MTCVTRGCHSCHCLINFSLVAVAAMVLQHTPFAYAMAIMASIPNPQSEPLGNAEEAGGFALNPEGVGDDGQEVSLRQKFTQACQYRLWNFVYWASFPVMSSPGCKS